MNPYPYVLNNPLKYVDPLGLYVGSPEGSIRSTIPGINTPGSTGNNATESSWGGCPPTVHEFGDDLFKGIQTINGENLSKSWTVVRENLPEGAGMFAREGKWLVETVTFTDLDNPYEVTLLLASGPTVKYTTKIAGIVLRKGGSRVYRFADEQSEYIFKKWVKGTGKTVDDLIKNATPGRATKGRTSQYELSGGFDKALKDFESLQPNIRKDTPDLKVGKLKDGRIVIVRKKSSDGRPTIEVQEGKKKIKFRY